ncbi:MAG: bifunctional (p)ppGpp synthetase/guanosine-3',5'-bis(diphosphate) 3'-pyrophosphohydrolase [Acidimicrobiaceae bacterium]|nr:bifunctional (p)ppGpp synthetase/guanosine-3',5'-bis(diphosphate) 3'-pyrophosphohydrolase [Acidimicrobiaceae bacterium]
MGNVAVSGQVDIDISGLEYLQSIYLARHPGHTAELIEKAWHGAVAAHVGQIRASGEPYFVHPYGVARIVASLGVDEITIAAALLHDSVEDTNVSIDELSALYDPVVATIVDGVTKLDRLSFESKEAQQAASMRKMLLAMAKDPRVLVIKLADRLHNMKTIGALPEWKQRRTAQETLDIYAPLAHRLGIQEIRWQLEDLAFATLHPRRYAEIDRMVTSRNPERGQYLDIVLKAAKDRLDEVGIKAEVSGRPKHLWSIYEKMVVKAKEFDDIYDIIGMRVITETEKDCWAALGVVHSVWSPVPGRFKDYINSPKFNLYQSLHTTVVSHGGNPLEIQIRTQDMHRRAEFGVAAHWGYKEGSSKDEIVWLNRIVDWQKETPDPAEFLESLRLDLEMDEVYVFSPKGKVITLPFGATPVDFAYSIHTEVGHRCIGAKVNQRLVPLDSKLKSGDTVEIFTSKVQNAGPSRDWLKLVVTPRARNKIRQWFSRERREDAIESGKDELTKSMRKENLPVQKLSASEPIAHISEALGYSDLDSLYAAIGQGHVSAKAVAQRLMRDLKGGDGEEQLPSTVSTSRTFHRKRKGAGVYVEGLDDVMIRLSKCCSPVPGDDITGFVTRGRGVSIHRTDCSNAVALANSNEDRLIEVEWDRDTTGIFAATVEIKALDRSHLLADVTRVLSEHHLNILSSSSQAGADRVSRMRFEFELADPSHLESVLASIKRLDSVFDAYRVLPAKSR